MSIVLVNEVFLLMSKWSAVADEPCKYLAELKKKKKRKKKAILIFEESCGYRCYVERERGDSWCGIQHQTRTRVVEISKHPFTQASAGSAGTLGGSLGLYSMFLYFFFFLPLAVSFSGTLATTKKAQLDSTSDMPLLGQPSFCLKLTSSLVLFFFFLFTTQDDLTVKRIVCTQPSVFCALYTAVSLSLMLSCLFLLSFLSINLSDISQLQRPHLLRAKSDPSLWDFFFFLISLNWERWGCVTLRWY